MIFKNAFRVYREEGLRELFYKGIDKAFRRKILTGLAYRLSMSRLTKRKRKEENLQDILDTVYNFRGYGVFKTIRPAQIRSELYDLAQLVKNRRPTTIMEIGTANGGTLYVWARYIKSFSKLISLDLPGGEFGGGYSKHHVSFFRRFSEENNLRFMRKNSHQKSTKEQVSSVLGGEEVDFLFIDGDHSYQGVKQDFEMYAPLVSSNGFIAFHDIVSGPRESVGGVPRYWKEVKSNYKTCEIIEDRGQEGYGIGVILENN